MTDQLRQAAQQALEALEFDRFTPEDETHRYYTKKAITALRNALEQEHALHELAALGQEIEQEPEQGPVAWMSSDKAWMWSDYSKALAAVANSPYLTLIPLYTQPPAAQRPWVGLTDEEISATSKGHIVRSTYARAIESKLKEKNT